MSFRTASLLKIMDKTTAAKEQLDKLEAQILADEATNKSTFFSKIDTSLSQTNITDAKEIEFSSNIITEFKSEISVEKIADIVASAVEAANSKMDPSVVALTTDPGTMKTYIDMINSVSEASKSSSSAATKLAYSMNRLSPGILVFLFASSKNINDTAIFGAETVTSTAIYYRIMQSIDDMKNEAAFDALQIDRESLAKMKTLQAALLDDLANGKIDFETWEKLDASYAKAASQINIRIAIALLKVGVLKTDPKNKPSPANQELVQASINKLSAKGGEVQVAVQKSKKRLSSKYF